MNTFRFSNLNMILINFVILSFQALKIFTPSLQWNKVVVFLELTVLLKLAKMSLRFIIFSSLRGRENKIISSADNTPDIEEKHGNGNSNNITTNKEERNSLRSWNLSPALRV